MADNQVRVTISDNGRRQFEQILARALRSRGNLLTLARCAGELKLSAVEQQARELVNGQGVITDIERGKALWKLLREAIDRLRPADSTPEHTLVWRLYAIAESVYIQGKSANQVTAELGLSPRVFHRARRAAVEALAIVVWQIEQQL